MTIYDSAVCDEAGVATFHEEHSRSGYSRLQGAAKLPVTSTNSFEAKTCRLDDLLLAAGRLDLIKFDIEGAELAALSGAPKVYYKVQAVVEPIGIFLWAVNMVIGVLSKLSFKTVQISKADQNTLISQARWYKISVRSPRQSF